MSSLSMSSSSAPAYSPDHISSLDQLCYVHCSFCDTVLAVSVPPSSLFKTVTVRCGHCSNLLSVSVSMRSLLLPSASNLSHSLPPPPNLLDHHQEMRVGGQNINMNMMMSQHGAADESLVMASRHGRVDHLQEMPRPPPPNRPPEKRQRVPSAYNRFIKEEIQRIKAGNPDISHREAFSAAAKNWAHFPHIHFGLMPEHPPSKKPTLRHQEGEDDVMIGSGREGFYASAAAAPPPPNLGLTHN